MEKESSENRKSERGKHSVSLENFGQRTGQVRALAEFRNRRERKRIETAKALRKYKKTMRSEGFEAGKGAARKREVAGTEKKPDVEHSGGVEKSSSSRRQKSNPLQKSIDKAIQKKVDAENMIKMKEDNEKEKKRKIRERKQQSKLLSRRTKRGQPIMKHTIGNLLRKLEK